MVRSQQTLCLFYFECQKHVDAVRKLNPKSIVNIVMFLNLVSFRMYFVLDAAVACERFKGFKLVFVGWPFRIKSAGHAPADIARWPCTRGPGVASFHVGLHHAWHGAEARLAPAAVFRGTHTSAGRTRVFSVALPCTRRRAEKEKDPGLNFVGCLGAFDTCLALTALLRTEQVRVISSADPLIGLSARARP